MVGYVLCLAVQRFHQELLAEGLPCWTRLCWVRLGDVPREV